MYLSGTHYKNGNVSMVDIVASQTHVYLNNRSLHLLHVDSPEGGTYWPLYLLFFFLLLLLLFLRSGLMYPTLALNSL